VLPAVPPGGGALHPGDAQGAGGGLRASAGSHRPVRDHGAGAGAAPHAGCCRACGPARPVLIELRSASPEETEAVAATLARELAVGDVVTVSGELGSGKTTFVRGACRALGVTAPVTSPTFTIGHRYPGEPDVSHL